MQAAIRKILSTVNCKLLTVLFLFSLFALTSTFAPPALAQSQCDVPENATDQEIINQFNVCAISENIYDDKIFNFNQIAGTIDSLNTSILGYSTLHPETDKLTMNRSALAQASTLTAALYANPPASGVQYLAQEIRKFNPVQPAYAQTGTGYDALTPVQDLWRVFRNASYVGFVIVFVVIGFMVMFRAHISPQTVATVQDSIPRIIIALILVTFSYAIAGLMLDIMFLAINIVIQLLDQSGVIKASEASKTIFDKSILGAITGAWGQIFVTTANAIKGLLDDIIGGGSIVGFISFVPKWGLSGIAALIVGIAALFIMFRILLMLLMAYVMIIILTLVAPFFFLIQALPGNTGAREWFKQMTANIAVFPAVSIMILLAGAIGGITAFGGTGTGTLKAVGDEALKFPLLVGGLDPGDIGKIIALGFLFMTPEAANLAKNAIGAKGPAFGGAGAAGLGASAGWLGRRASQTSVARGIGEALEVGGQQRAARFANLVPARLRGGQEIQAPVPQIRGRVKT